MTFLPLLALGVSPFDVYVGAKPVTYKRAKPVRNGNLFLVPLRETVEAMGGTYVEGPLRRHVYLTVARRRVDLALDGSRSRVDGGLKRLKAMPWISHGAVVVSRGFFTEALHATVITGPHGHFVRIIPGGGFAAPRTP